MIKIQKDGHTLNVTVGTYDNIFKGMGYEIVGSKVEKVEKVEEQKVVENKKVEEPVVKKTNIKGAKYDIQNK